MTIGGNFEPFQYFDFETNFLENEKSSIGKWGGQLKSTKREIPDYMILELYGTKRDILQNPNKLNKFFNTLNFCFVIFYTLQF